MTGERGMNVQPSLRRIVAVVAAAA